MACDDESAECKRARTDFDQAEFDKGTIEAEIASLTDSRNLGGAVAGLLIGALLVASGPPGWVIGVGLAGAAAGGGGGGLFSSSA